MCIKNKAVNILTCWFGAGALPGPRGTWGSLAALPFAYGLYSVGGERALVIAAIVCFFVGVIVVDLYVKRTGTKDPSFAVIDEVAGQWLTLAVTNGTLMSFVIGFFLFRFFDILKPPPARNLESLPGGLGVMADDMAAGAYAAGILYFLQKYAGGLFII